MGFSRQLSGVSSLFLPCQFWVLNSCPMTWQQVPLLPEPHLSSLLQEFSGRLTGRQSPLSRLQKVSVVGSCWNQACLWFQAAAAHYARGGVPQEGWESQSLTQAVGNHCLVGFAFNPNSSDHEAIDDTAEWTTGNINTADQFLVWGSRGLPLPFPLGKGTLEGSQPFLPATFSVLKDCKSQLDGAANVLNEEMKT